jgi:predicted phage terminase large subunit-like protein
VLGIQEQLKALEVMPEKHIPRLYLRASQTQRLWLLQGLIDTDGHIAPDGQVEFCSTNLRLAEGARELVHSLGRKASMIAGRATLDGRDCGPKYRVMFYLANAATLPRKRIFCRNVEKTPHRYISADPCGTADTVCIQVDSESGMFLCGRSMLPTHNSELVSRLFSAYWLYRYPKRWVGLACYGANLAYTLSRSARENFRTAQGMVGGNTEAVEHWQTTAGGGMWAAGIGGPMLGKGWHLGIIDDPVKNVEEALSDTIQEKHRDWYQSTFLTREEPDPDTEELDGAIIIVAQRWADTDLPGWLLSQETAEDDEEDAEHWHVVSLEAIKEDTPPELPATCTVEPDWREPGKALCPERRPLEKLHRILKRIGDYFFSAVFQQRPAPKRGTMFDPAWFEIVDAVPADVKAKIRYWDKAGTKGGGAATAGVLMSRSMYDVYYIEDVNLGHWAAADREPAIKQTAEIDGRSVLVYVEQEPGSGGKESAENTVKMLAGWVAEAERVTGNKVLRAEPLASQAKAGNVKLLKGPWNKAFLEEARKFPRGKFKDQIDGASGAFNKLASRQEEKPYCSMTGGTPHTPLSRVQNR